MNIIYSVLFNLMILVLVAIAYLLVNDKFRKKYWKAHRIMWWIYLVISTFISIYIIINTFQRSYGLIAKTGMQITAILWFVYLIQAFRFDLKKRIFAHKIWLKRVFFINCAFLLAPIMLAIFEIFGNEFPLYIALSYTLNVIIMLSVSEFVLNKKQTIIKN